MLSLEGCHAEKSFAPLSVAGRMSYQPSMSFHPSNSGKTLDRMGEGADDLGMVMRVGQRRPPDPGESPRYRFESCIAHFCPQDSSPAQPNADRTPSDGGSVWPRATSGDSLAAGGFLSAPDARVATPGVGLDSPSATDGAQLIPLGGGWNAPSSGFALLSSLSILGGGTTMSLPGFRPAVGQAAGRDSDCHLLSEGKTHPTRSCGLSRSQLVALLRASDDVRDAVAALLGGTA